ncbi:MAG: 1,4-alpha-glucan-branching enzyme, partial [Aquabacterium sp.]|nr:1,4-alpha-glucan-branching enzyme [Ferruginibacter sp.]
MNPNEQLAIISEDPWLQPYAHDVNERLARFKKALTDIENAAGSLLNFANGHQYYGIHFDTKHNGWFYREWAPNASKLHLTGDFNGWNRTSHPLQKNLQGDWELFLPYEANKNSFVHGSKVKVTVHGANGETDRIPAWIRRVVQDPATHDFAGQLWFPDKKFSWTDDHFNLAQNIKQPIIYECHVGMAQEEEKVGTYLEFADKILPR